MWHLRQAHSVRDMSRLKRYVISVSLVFVGLAFVIALFGAAWLSAY